MEVGSINVIINEISILTLHNDASLLHFRVVVGVIHAKTVCALLNIYDYNQMNT